MDRLTEDDCSKETVLSEDVIRVLQEKDKTMRSMARKISNLEKQIVKFRDWDNLKSKRISKLEYENDKLAKEKDTLSTKLMLLAYKLQMNTPKYKKSVR